jgi:hypothetical protein
MSTKSKIVFALYRPHAGKGAELLQAVAMHYPVLRKLELITDRTPVIARAKRRIDRRSVRMGFRGSRPTGA